MIIPQFGVLFDPDCRRGGTVLIHKQPDNIWRIDYQLNDNEKTQQALYENNILTVYQQF